MFTYYGKGKNSSGLDSGLESEDSPETDNEMFRISSRLDEGGKF